MKKVICIFCNQEKEKAKEHIWPRWLQTRIGGSTKGTFAGTHAKLGVIPISERISSGENLVLGTVCKDCNNGWMERLESEFRLILDILLENSEKITLNKKESVIISRWAFKTACVINKGSNFHQIIPEEHFRYFYKHEKLPSNVIVEIGKLQNIEDESLAWRQGKIQLIISPSSESMIYTNVAQKSYIISMQISSLLIRVAYWPMKISHFNKSEDDKKKIKRIWPATNKIDFNKIIASDNLDSFSLSVHIVINKNS